MKNIITIGRQYGSGGRYIAKKVAALLGVKCYDSELILKIAKEHGFDESIVKEYDEKGTSFADFFVPLSAGVNLQSRIIEAQFDTIRLLSEKESCVIVGRCADYVLRDSKTVLSVFIMSDMDNRVKRGIDFYKLDEKKAYDIIKKTDKKRGSYYNFYTDKKWGKADSYNLCVDSKIGIDETAAVIKAYADKFFAE